MKETASQPLSAALFRNPTSEYRGAPFWAWNGRADDHALMQQQIDTFQAMGFGGFHIHARIGLSSEYMGKDFMESVKFCHEYAQRKDMLTYLYDEDKWPSGYGAGRVTGDPKNRARYLLPSPTPPSPCPLLIPKTATPWSRCTPSSAPLLSAPTARSSPR